MRVADAEVEVAGEGKPLLMLHGWPDSLRLWDGQVAALEERYRCVRMTLPGYDNPHGRAYSVDEVLETIRRVIEHACDGARVTLMLHDWGCLYGYQFAVRHPELVERVVGVDIGDAGSRSHLAEIGRGGMLGIFAYQVFLACAWRLGGPVGDAMARWMARRLRCPTDQATIGAQMGYPYASRWLGAAGGFKGLRVFNPQVPMLYLYGEKKPFMFHSKAWAERLAARPQCRVAAFDTGHWIMVSRRAGAFNQAVLAWLEETD